MKPIQNEKSKLRFDIGDIVRYLNAPDITFQIKGLLPCNHASCQSKNEGKCDGFSLIDGRGENWHPCPGELKRIED